MRIRFELMSFCGFAFLLHQKACVLRWSLILMAEFGKASWCTAPVGVDASLLLADQPSLMALRNFFVYLKRLSEITSARTWKRKRQKKKFLRSKWRKADTAKRKLWPAYFGENSARKSELGSSLTPNSFSASLAKGALEPRPKVNTSWKLEWTRMKGKATRTTVWCKFSWCRNEPRSKYRWL